MGVGVVQVGPLGIKGANGSSIATATNPLPTESHGTQPDGNLLGQKSDGEVFQNNTPLAGGSAFTSAWQDTDGWRSIELFVATDQPSATDGIEVQYTDDTQAATPTVRGSITRAFTADDIARGFALIYLPTALDGFRVKYTNGATLQGSFFIAATLHAVSIESPQGPVEGQITATENAVNVRAVMAAKDTVSGDYGNVGASPTGDSIANPDPALDMNAFTLGFDEDTGTWNRIRSRQPVDEMTNPGKALNASSFQMLWNPDGTPANRWNRMVGKPLADGQAEQIAALVGSRLQFWNGLTWDRAPGSTSNGLDVDVTRSALPAGAATAANQQTDALTNTELRATPVPVSGPLTDTQLRATDVAITLAGEQVDVSDRAARDLGKVDIASLDQYTPTDVDSGVGTENAVPVSWRKTASGGSAEFGTATDPVRTDPTGTTTQPVSGTVAVSNTEYPLPASQVTTLTPQTDALTDTQLRASAVDVKTSSAILDSVLAGEVFRAGGQVDITAGNTGALAIATSATTPILILGFSAAHIQPDELPIEFVRNPTVTGGTAQPAMNHSIRADPQGNTANVTTGTSILSGGTTLSPVGQMRDQETFKYDGLPIYVPVSTTMGLMVTVSALLSNTTARFNIVWKELV